MQVSITVIQVVEQGISIVKCLGCVGTGTYTKGGEYPNGADHSPCGGAGILTIKHSAPLVVCSGCNGTGRSNWSYGYQPHTPCGGTGIIAAYGDFSFLPRRLVK